GVSPATQGGTTHSAHDARAEGGAQRPHPSGDRGLPLTRTARLSTGLRGRRRSTGGQQEEQMSTENPASNPADDPAAGGGDKGFKAPTSQAEFDAMVKDRIARVQAKYADYDDLRAKAEQFDSVQEASKTEAQKTADRIAKLEQELESTRTTALRSRIQAKHGISDEDAALFLTATDEATLTKQAE